MVLEYTEIDALIQRRDVRILRSLQGVTPKAGVHEEQKEKDQVKPSNVINLTALFFEKDGGLITHIFAARQLSYDEAHRKVTSLSSLTNCRSQSKHERQQLRYKT